MRWGVLVGILIFTPLGVFAANTNFFGPIVPACTEYAGNIAMCQACNLVQLADNLLKFFVSLAVMAAAIMFAYAGFLYVTAASNQHNLESAKKIFWNVLIGLIFVLAAFLIVDLILRVFTGSDTKVWTEIKCVRIEQSGLQFNFPVVEPATEVVGSQGGGDSPSAPGSYCTEAALPGFESMIGNAIDKYGSNLTTGGMTGISEYCPNYNSPSMTPEQRKAFWTRYMTGVAKYESSCNPSKDGFNESQYCRDNPNICSPSVDSVTKGDVLSEGLFQLSYGSERGRAKSAGDGTCYFDPAKQDIRDATKNTNCAIFILNQDVNGSGSKCTTQFECATRYWAVARSKKAQLIDITKSVPGCR